VAAIGNYSSSNVTPQKFDFDTHTSARRAPSIGHLEYDSSDGPSSSDPSLIDVSMLEIIRRSYIRKDIDDRSFLAWRLLEEMLALQPVAFASLNK
jgi:hypothetical protein